MPHSPIHIATEEHPIPGKARRRLTSFDKLVLVVSVIYPFSAFPQVIMVLNGHTEGVSVLSWVVFMLCASLFLVYGIRRQVLPMIVSNSIWIIMDALIVVGVLIS